MATQRALIVHFVAGTTARTAAELVGVNRHTATLYFHKLREIIAEQQAKESPFAEGDIEVDESYFGGYRRGKHGRGAAGKVPVFGLLKRGGKVYATMIPDVQSQTLMGVMARKIRPDSIVYTDAYSGYNILDVSGFHHKRVNHKETYVTPTAHINGIENFWNQAKRALRRYNGVPKQNFHLFLKECEWRFNTRPVSKQLAVLTRWAGV